MSQNTLFSLKMQLKNFGLNPEEWHLESIEGLSVRVQKCDDENFTFLGTLEQKANSYRWQTMQLISL